MSEFGRFFLPGPTEVRPEVLEAMRRPMIGHRGPEIVELIGGMRAALSSLFRTERPVYLSTSSSTGMMEAAVTNLVRRRALCCVCGAFGGRFAAIAEACGRPFDRLEAEWGDPILPERVAARLAEEPGRHDLVTVVHSESSTGVLSPVAEIASAVREHEDVLIVVDAVSSLAGAPILTDEWGLDFVLAGSQKALALPPGLALAVASERAIERAREVGNRGYYFDLLAFERRMEGDQTPSTPAVSQLYALEAQLRWIEREGLDNRWRRHWAMARRVHDRVEELSGRTGRPFRVLAPDAYRSPSVTAVVLPEELSGPDLVARLRERGYTIGAGYGRLKERNVRIGHMGDHTMEELEALLETLDEVVDEALEGARVG